MESNPQQAKINNRKSNRILGMTSTQITILSILACFGLASIGLLAGLIFNNTPISYPTKIPPTKNISGQDARSVLVIHDEECGRSPENRRVYIATTYITNTSDFDVAGVVVAVKMLEAGHFFTREDNYYDPLSLGAHETSLLSFYPSVSTGANGVSCKWLIDNAVYK